jgi:hypothetical protein
MSKRLTDRYDVESLRLRPQNQPEHRRLISIITSLYSNGSVYHCLAQTPYNDGGEIYTVLVDDEAVIRLDLPGGSSEPEEVQIWTFDEYRRAIGQGHHRILLDHAAEAARSR